MKALKVKVASFGVAVAMLVSLTPAVFAAEVMPQDGTVLQVYTAEDIAQATPTMEDVMENFSKDDIAAMIAVEKAREMPASYQYQSYEATDEDIAGFYAELASVLETYPGNWYFSSMYWQRRSGFTTLSLEPSSNMDGFLSIAQAAAAWTLVRNTVSSSQYWGNEGGMKDQFDCHALGEVGLEVGTWDLEVERPDVGYIMTVLAQCNPKGISV